MRRVGVLLSLLIGWSCANATIINSDFILPGDGLVTTDSITGSQWLDPSVFAGLSYDQIETRLDTLAAFQGFHIATFDELTDLMINAGWRYYYDDRNTRPPGERSFGNVSPLTPETLTFMSSIGVRETFARDPSWVQYVATGYIAGIDGDYGVADLRYVFVGGTTETNSGIQEFGGLRGIDPGSVGAFVVRTVPEPSTLALSLIGVAMLAGTRRRHRSPAHHRTAHHRTPQHTHWTPINCCPLIDGCPDSHVLGNKTCADTSSPVKCLDMQVRSRNPLVFPPVPGPG